VNRIVEPEILDELVPTDPDAVRSRRDLCMINSLMGGQKWIAKQIQQIQEVCKLAKMGKVTRIVELGAGDGMLSQQLKGLFPDCEVVAVDLISRPESVRGDVVWEKVNVMEYGGFDENTVVVANLFIHHLQEDELRLLGGRLSSVRAVVLAEPHRKASAIFMGRMIFPIINHVTRHDMITSIRAGFIKGEVSVLLGEGFEWRESTGLLGGIRMMGVRR